MDAQTIKKARGYAKQYSFPLVKRWDGTKEFWHVWHQPHLIYFLLYDEYINRIVEIAETKPQEQRTGRFALMRPVKHMFPHAAWTKADAARTKADAARTKAYVAFTKADAARTKAAAAWRDKNHDAIIDAHAAECPGCKWDGHMLPQFN